MGAGGRDAGQMLDISREGLLHAGRGPPRHPRPACCSTAGFDPGPGRGGSPPSQPWGPPGASLWSSAEMKSWERPEQKCVRLGARGLSPAPKGATRGRPYLIGRGHRGIPGGKPGSGAGRQLSALGSSEFPVTGACKEKLTQRGPRQSGQSRLGSAWSPPRSPMETQAGGAHGGDSIAGTPC